MGLINPIRLDKPSALVNRNSLPKVCICETMSKLISASRDYTTKLEVEKETFKRAELTESVEAISQRIEDVNKTISDAMKIGGKMDCTSSEMRRKMNRMFGWT